MGVHRIIYLLRGLQRELKNASNLDHVYVMQQLQQPSALRIRECDVVTTDGGESAFHNTLSGTRSGNNASYNYARLQLLKVQELLDCWTYGV